MISVRFLNFGELELISINGIKNKVVNGGYIYQVNKVVYSNDSLEADLYFKEGCAEGVPTELFELHGDLSEVEYKR